MAEVFDPNSVFNDPFEHIDRNRTIGTFGSNTLLNKYRQEQHSKSSKASINTLTNSIKELTNEDGNSSAGYISTIDIDHSGDVVVPHGCILDIFKKNPVIFYNHNKSELPSYES
jgi:hypothetical protein